MQTDMTVADDGKSGVERLVAEGPIGMTQAARMFGTFRNGKPVHTSTVSRWATGGISTAGGDVLRLESFRLNGRLCTSRQAVLRFISAQNPHVAGPPAAAPVSPAERLRSSTAAEQELIARGA